MADAEGSDTPKLAPWVVIVNQRLASLEEALEDQEMRILDLQGLLQEVRDMVEELDSRFG